MPNFRDKAPVRTCTKSYANYGDYKDYLAEDFFNRCGYTDCSDFWFGGPNNFHIDHFKPWKNYPAQPNLKTDYANLIYCCSYVNILKSNDETDYIDPCNVDYNLHFSRSEDGAILPVTTSSSGNYMYKRLKLYMLRYRIIWTLDKLHTRLQKLQNAINNPQNAHIAATLKDIYFDLSSEMTEYLDYLKGNQ